MSAVVRAIRYAEVFDAPHAEALLTEYSSECALRAIGNADPQPDMYAQLEASGLLQVYGAYLGDRLIGFAAVLCSILPHYGQKVATVESLFVEGEHRDTGAGIKLMAAIERHAKDAGCKAILYSAPEGSQLATLLRILKSYQHTNSVFCRRLA